MPGTILVVVFEVFHGDLELFRGSFGGIRYRFFGLGCGVPGLVGLALCLICAFFGPLGPLLGSVGRILREVGALLGLIGSVSRVVREVAGLIPVRAIGRVLGPVRFPLGPVGFALGPIRFALSQVR